MSLLLLLAAFPTCGAYFGKNKVGYNDLEWQVIETAHFRIHFYEEERDLALETIPLAEAIHHDLSDRLGHDLRRPVPLVLYSSHPEFQRTNITAGWVGEGTGGVTEFIKRRVFLPYPGSRDEYRHVLEHELVHAFQVDILSPNGSLRDLVRIRVPLWMLEGMAEYLSVGREDPLTTMWVRDALLDGPTPSFATLSRFTDVRIYRLGQSAWGFLAGTYGEETPGDFLRALAVSGDAEEAVHTVFGKSSADLSLEWQEALRKEHYPALAALERAGAVSTKIESEGEVNVAPAISPSGDHLLFLSDRDGSLSLYAGDRFGLSCRRLVEGGSSKGVESLRPFHGGARWSPDGRSFLFPAQKGAEDVLYLYDWRAKTIDRTFAFGMEEVRGFTWSPGGEEIVLAGMKKGRTDLYRIDLLTGEMIRLTDDRFVYLHPDWSPDGRQIVCATDRLESEGSGPRDRKLRLAFLELASGKWTIPPDQTGNHHSPAWSADGKRIAFVSDGSGTWSLYVRRFEQGTARPISSLEGGVCGLLGTSPAFSWSRETGEIFFSYFRGKEWSIYRMENPGAGDDPVAPPPAPPPSIVAEVRDSTEQARPPLDFMPPYRIRPYRANLSLDLATGGTSAMAEGGLYSGSAVSFSDLLGNHRLHLLFGIYGSLESSDLYVAYENLERRVEYEVALFQFMREGSDWYGGSGWRTLYRGASFQFRHPFDRYRRLECGIRLGEAGEIESDGTVAFLGASGVFVLDNVLWASYGARSGERLRISMEPIVAGGLGAWLHADLRAYRDCGQHLVLATRTIGGNLFGEHVPAFRVAPRFLIRGFYQSPRNEKRYMAQSVELRFPLLELLRLGWPVPVSLTGIRGVFFADAGYFPDYDRAQRHRYAYGVGLRMQLGPFQLMLDFPQKSDGRRKIGRMKGFFQIGRDF